MVVEALVFGMFPGGGLGTVGVCKMLSDGGTERGTLGVWNVV